LSLFSNAANPAEADLVKSRLEANGFMVNLKDEKDAISFGYGLSVGGVASAGCPRIKPQ